MHDPGSEELSALVYEAVGAAAPRVYRIAPNELLIEYLDGFTVPQGKVADLAGKRLLGLGDALALYTDRWQANIMVDAEDRVAGIDHEFCFGEAEDGLQPRGLSQWAKPYIDTLGIENGAFAYTWAENTLTPEEVAQIGSRLWTLRANFALRGRMDWFADLWGRWQAIAAHARG